MLCQSGRSGLKNDYQILAFVILEIIFVFIIVMIMIVVMVTGGETRRFADMPGGEITEFWPVFTQGA